MALSGDGQGIALPTLGAQNFAIKGDSVSLLKTNVAPETEQDGEAEGEARSRASNQGDSCGNLGKQVGDYGDGSGGQGDDVNGKETTQATGTGAVVRPGDRGNDDGNGVGRGNGGAAAGGQWPAGELATRGQEDLATRGLVAPPETAAPNLLQFESGRQKRQSSPQHTLTTRGQGKVATRGQGALAKRARRLAASGHYVEAVKASKGTWAFRIRWRDIHGKRPVVYVSRVSDQVYDLIKGGDYEAFKRQLIAGHSASTLRSGHTA